MNYTNSHILDANPGPIGFAIKDYCAVPCGNQLMILHNGQQIKMCRTSQSARNFIRNQMKTK